MARSLSYGGPRSPMSCLDANTLLAFLDGSLSGTERLRAQEHIAGCESCADVVVGVRPRAVEGRGLARGTSVGRYVLLDLVGRGGMGEVYAAYDPQLDR